MEKVAFKDTYIEYSILERLSRETLDWLYRNHTLRGGMYCSMMKEYISRERRRRQRHNGHLNYYAKLHVAILRDSEDRIMGWVLCGTRLYHNMTTKPKLQVFVQRRFRGQLHGGRLAHLFARKIQKYYGCSDFVVYNNNINHSISKYQKKYTRTADDVRFKLIYS